MSRTLITLMKTKSMRKILLIMEILFSVVPDRLYLRLFYFMRCGKVLHLSRPITFNEKIQYLKVTDNNPIHVLMSDKLRCRGYISREIGEEYLIPLIGNKGGYKNALDIDISQFPDEFVVKCTHDSGSVEVFHSHSDFTKEKRKKLNCALKRKYYLKGRENLYKGIEPRIICEKYMCEKTGGLTDFKFYCFNGEPKFLYVSTGLTDHSTAQITFFDIDLTISPFQRSDYKHHSGIPFVPKNYEKMLQICRKLSKGIPFVRVDLYEIDEKVYFSEFTFYPCSGVMPFAPKEYDKLLGDMMEI